MKKPIENSTITLFKTIADPDLVAFFTKYRDQQEVMRLLFSINSREVGGLFSFHEEMYAVQEVLRYIDQDSQFTVVDLKDNKVQCIISVVIKPHRPRDWYHSGICFNPNNLEKYAEEAHVSTRQYRGDFGNPNCIYSDAVAKTIRLYLNIGREKFIEVIDDLGNLMSLKEGAMYADVFDKAIVRHKLTLKNVDKFTFSMVLHGGVLYLLAAKKKPLRDTAAKQQNANDESIF